MNGHNTNHDESNRGAMSISSILSGGERRASDASQQPPPGQPIHAQQQPQPVHQQPPPPGLHHPPPPPPHLSPHQTHQAPHISPQHSPQNGHSMPGPPGPPPMMGHEQHYMPPQPPHHQQQSPPMMGHPHHQGHPGAHPQPPHHHSPQHSSPPMLQQHQHHPSTSPPMYHKQQLGQNQPLSQHPHNPGHMSPQGMAPGHMSPHQHHVPPAHGQPPPPDMYARMYMSQQQMPQQAPWPIQIPIQGHTSVDGEHTVPDSPPADADDPAFADAKKGFLQQIHSRLEAVVQLEELRDKVVIDEYTKTKAYTNAARYAAVKQSAKTSLQKEAIVRVAFVEYEEGGGAPPSTKFADSAAAAAATAASSSPASSAPPTSAASTASATTSTSVSTPKPKKRSKAVSKTSAAASTAAGTSSKESSPAPKPKTKKQLQAEQREKDRELREENAAAKEAAAAAKQLDQQYDAIWKDMARRDAAKVHKTVAATIAVKQSNHRKTAVLASKEARRWQYRTNKSVKDMQGKARRAMREMLSFWKRNEKEERDLRKKAEKEALDQAKKDEEDRESKRQARKLNFLLTQTELYSHFIGRKIKTDEMEDGEAKKDAEGDEDYQAMEQIAQSGSEVETKRAAELDFDEEDDAKLRQIAMQNAHNQVKRNQAAAQAFDEAASKEAASNEAASGDSDDAFQNPTSLGDLQLSQPKLLNCTLKEYQLKGLNWLANLYEQGINGILADEMGLGKTVQSISVMAYLAETHNIWGPYLVIAPASTLHNWQQEISKFVPDFKVLPYWGNGKDRKILRKFWDRKNVKYTRDSPFHVLVTSYQLVVSDAQYFSRVKWQYMILDEAQAIKSSSSSRWKSLLAFQCRNRLLLTGTPIQNSMQELWALLHFIMPSLFDSHDEFSEWFSKDIESHAKEKSQLDQQQLKRLHMILKPFMLRRVKKHVQQELGDKIEIDVYCNLTTRQRVMYKILKSQINLQELLAKAQSGGEENTQSLMNLVMQFRKVCNHPDLFERADVKSAYNFGPSNCGSDKDTWIGSSNRNLIKFEVPKLIYREGGFLDVPGEDSKSGGLNKLLKVDLNIWEPSWMNKKRDLVVEEEGGVGRVSKVSQMGVLERVINELSGDVPTVGALPRYAAPTSPFDVSETLYDSYLHRLEPAYDPRVVAPPVDFVCRDRGFQIEQEEKMDGVEVRRALTPLTLGQELWWLEKAEKEAQSKLVTPSSVALPPNDLFPSQVLDFNGINTLRMPSMSKFISCSGKLAKLDELLAELKAGGHRVLVYFQMTKMMDLAEEYLTFKQYNYCRLDGSSKLSDRRDLVNDWQTKPELFVFLLSTRAGGLGINLTAADTVIFYDSDWNPTIDSQAMDRAHRLGQTRQVTVYRLLVKGTIEERMRDRAKQKEHVQNVVMSGQSQSHEEEVSSKPSRDVALWLLDDDQDEASFVKGKENRGVKRGADGEEEKKDEEVKKPKTE